MEIIYIYSVIDNLDENLTNDEKISKNHQIEFRRSWIIQEKVNNENNCSDIQICNITILEHVKNTKFFFKYKGHS